VSFLYVFRLKCIYCLVNAFYTPDHLILLDLIIQIKRSNYDIPHWVIFSILVLFLFLGFKYSSQHYYQSSLIYVFPIRQEIKFHTHIKHRMGKA